MTSTDRRGDDVHQAGHGIFSCSAESMVTWDAAPNARRAGHGTSKVKVARNATLRFARADIESAFPKHRANGGNSVNKGPLDQRGIEQQFSDPAYKN